MSSPCGKCNTCPCGSGKSPQPKEQQVTCGQPPVQPEPPQTSTRKPKVECLCTRDKRRDQTPQTAPLQAPLADNYTCSRPQPKPEPYVPAEQRCTCKQKPPVQCECAPPVVAPQAESSCPRSQAEPTHAHITCGQPVPYQNTRGGVPQYQPSQRRCGHCQGQKKKCIIQ